MFINKIKSKQNGGFTLVEMLIVAPLVLLVIGIFVSAIVSMTGSVMSTRGANMLSYNIQNALESIDNDTRISGGYLATNNITLQAGQGYNAVQGNNTDTTAFYNVSSGNEDMLILNSYATNSNPSSVNRTYVFMANQPNTCDSSYVTQNSTMMFNIIYFVKNGTLWRRVIMPSNYASAGCNVPWQQPSCAPDVVATVCKIQDTKLVDGVQTGGFDIKYYTETDPDNEIVDAVNNTLSDSTRQAALATASSISVTINASSTTAGRTFTKSGQIRTQSPNDKTASS